VKQCTVSTVGGVGTFDVIVTPPAGLVINVEEPVTGMQPPPSSSYRAIFSGATATVVPLRRDPIAGATVHFDTAHLHVTLNLRLGGTPDTQLLLVDPRRPARDEEVERRVHEALAGLEERAQERAERLLVEELAAHGAEVLGAGVDPNRHHAVVLRVTRRVRIGARLGLLFSVENRSGDPLTIRAVRLWTARGGAEHEVTAAPHALGSKELPVNAEVTGAILVPPAAAGQADRLRLRVETSDPERAVELAGIRAR
jgi:hypothetical protein